MIDVGTNCGAKQASSAPWSKMIASRNRLAHGCWSIDLLLVWGVVQNDLPTLKAEIERLQAALIRPAAP